MLTTINIILFLNYITVIIIYFAETLTMPFYRLERQDIFTRYVINVFFATHTALATSSPTLYTTNTASSSSSPKLIIIGNSSMW